MREAFYRRMKTRLPVPDLTWSIVPLLAASANIVHADPQLSRLHSLPAEQARLGEVRTIMPGDIVLETSLTYENTASVISAHQILLAGLPFGVDRQDLLRKADSSTFSPPFSQTADVYCSGSIDLPSAVREVTPPPGRVPRFERKVRWCLVDDDRDRTFDRAVLIGARWQEDQQPTSVQPIAYQMNQFSTQHTGQLRITYLRGAALQGPILQLSSNILNGNYQISDARIGPDLKKAKFVGSEKSVAGQYPKSIAYGDAQISILGLNPETRALTIRIDKNFEVRPTIVVVGFYGMFGTTEYTFK